MQNSQPRPSRRSFFAGAATVSAAAAAVVALPHVAPSATDTASSEPPRVAPEKGGGYHLSAHVKQYYKTTQL
jgi:hypothetical protein